MAQKAKSGFQISYVTITYRSVALGALCVLLLAGIVLYFVFPDRANKMVQSGESLLQTLLVKVGLASSPNPGGPGTEAGPQQAHFTQIDGSVKVIRANKTVIPADYNVVLEKGDVIQTTSEGLAKIVFADGTNYTIKPDSLIVVQESSVNSAQQTRVSVEVTTGMVDLSTSTLSKGSESQVTVAGATATLGSDTSAEVQNDLHNDQHSILLKKGTGEVSRGNETVKIGEYDRLAFKLDSPQMSKTKEIGPPTLIQPSNMQPVFVGNKTVPVDFSWTPMDNVREYHLRISRNSYFSSLVFNATVKASQVQLTGLAEGPYYWEVQSVAETGKISVESEKNRFTVILKGDEKVNIPLDVDYSQHGHIIEVRGQTEPTARVMVNGQQVVVIGKDGSFHHFTAPLPTGENIITVTAQNAKGGFNTKTKTVVIQ